MEASTTTAKVWISEEGVDEHRFVTGGTTNDDADLVRVVWPMEALGFC